MQISSNRFSMIPISIADLIRRIPNKINPFFGIRHISNNLIIKTYDSFAIEQQRQFVFEKFKWIIEYAYSNIQFYFDFYNQCGFTPDSLRSFDDIRSVPIINKEILLNYPLEKRSCEVKGSIKVNTGGSSGHTLDFYQQYSENKYHDLIHMNHIWRSLDYKFSDTILGMSGISNIGQGIAYSIRNNAIVLDTYRSFDQLAPKLKSIAKLRPIRFLHGYPSILYEFAIYCNDYDHDLMKTLRKTLKGAFLGSEYPHPTFRDCIEDVFHINTINWYGHTEGAVLAYEKDSKYRYNPFQTYGFSEISEDCHLLGTTYFNLSSPFIRYDTEDSVTDPEVINGILVSFELKNGRQGEYILDKSGKKISLTGLIFGRHHKLFDYCTHIQVCQKEKGQAIILYVKRAESMDFNPIQLFDSNNIEMNFTFREIPAPLKTRGGKLNLLVTKDQLEDYV